jgi:hypothetical protein
MYLGSWNIDDAVTFPVNTHNASTGAASDADSAPSYRVYEDETTTPILTGTMALLDAANTVGLYSEQLTLSAANGFEQGKSYTVYIAATVSSVTGTTSHSFQIRAGVAMDSGVLNTIADAILKRDFTAITGEASRSLLNAVRFLRNKWSISGSTLTVTKEDDATTAFTAALTTDSGADPITASDPS